jgi:hypothetical protein
VPVIDVSCGLVTTKITTDLNAGDKLYFSVFPPATFEVINPEHLLQKLVDKITDTKTYAGNPPCPAAIELTEEDCTDLKISVDKDYLFSGLKIGYKKKEYGNAMDTD